MKVTHQEIADAVGVSRVAVSQVLNRSRSARIGADKQREILRVARHLGYSPRNRTTHNIGYVNQTSSLAFAAENRFLFLIDRALREAGYRLLLTSVDSDDPSSLREALNSKTVDGVIFTRYFGGKVKSLLPPSVPWLVLSDDDSIPPDVDKVTLDSAGIAEMVTRHLLEHGHSQIGLVTSVGEGGLTSHIKQGIARALRTSGVAGAQLYSVEVQYDREIAEPLLARLRGPRRPTALITVGAEKTITALHILTTNGLRVPRDMSVVSLIDSHMLEPLQPAITSTTAMGFDLAERAVARLLDKIEGREIDQRHVLVPAELVVRQSVAPPPAATVITRR